MHRGSARRTFLREVFGALGAASLARPAAAATKTLRPARGEAAGRGKHPHHEARDVPRQAALAVPEGPHRRRHRRPRRAGRRRAGADVRRGRQGDRAVPGRQGPAAGRPPLAGDLPPRLLSRRPDPHQRAQRHRHGAVGHQGQGARRAGLRAARRADARPRPRLRPRAHAGGDQGSDMAQGFTAFKTGPAKRRPAALRRDAGRGRSTPPSSSPRCARRPATTSTSASTSTARSARPRPSCSSRRWSRTSRCSSRSRSTARTTT